MNCRQLCAFLLFSPHADNSECIEINSLPETGGIGHSVVSDAVYCLGEPYRRTPKKSRNPNWGNIKTHVAGFDRNRLIDLIHDLYDASSENRLFLHTRFGAGDEVLEPYLKTLRRCLWPDVCCTSQAVSVSKALKTISDYKKANGKPEELLELMTSYCEQVAGFTLEIGMDGEGWFNSFLRVFQDAVKLVGTLPEDQQAAYIERLDHMRKISDQFGWGVGIEANDIWEECARALPEQGA